MLLGVINPIFLRTLSRYRAQSQVFVVALQPEFFFFYVCVCPGDFVNALSKTDSSVLIWFGECAEQQVGRVINQSPRR